MGDADLFDPVMILCHFNDLSDLRQPGKITYPLAKVLPLAQLAMLTGTESFVEIARFGEKKLDLLRRLRPFRDETPSHDHLGDSLAAWVSALTDLPVSVVAIDGKTVRRWGGKAGKGAIHAVSP